LFSEPRSPHHDFAITNRDDGDGDGDGDSDSESESKSCRLSTMFRVARLATMIVSRGI
jgi:hypothetical protein